MQKVIDSIINSILSNNFSAKTDELIKIAEKLIEGNSNNELIHTFLEIGHFPNVNELFYNSEVQEEWYYLLLKLIVKSKYHSGVLLKQRAERYPDKTLFQTINSNKVNKISFAKSWQRIKNIGLSLHTITSEIKNPVIGILSPNSLETALVDLACLSFNFKIVPIPANSSKEHLKYILVHSNITHLFINGDEQINLLKSIYHDLSGLTTITLLESKRLENSVKWSDFLNFSNPKKEQELFNRLNNIKMDDVTTIMYTSGTTANPKGIIFTQTTIISKRFARALALPDVGSSDTFLCFLPLYHTFGRYLELMGSIFWGASYTFAESPSFKSLIKNLKTNKPTIFISIPKRWLQIYDMVLSHETATNDDTKKYLKDIIGGKLRLGLSAAGYLDPDIFTFFHKNGIQLLSGYGMTEATGGITMTPQNDYIKDSVGIPLPGITLKLGTDNELLLKGSYITKYYHGAKKQSSLKNGWFHTGDIFKEKNGHYFIIDRKKEIYKNSRGVTISPQKIENLFQDFDAVKSVFLIGDGMPYNTVLIYPDKNWFDSISQDQDFDINDYFSSLIQSVNSFLAHYERIVNFAIIDRDFSSQYGELTPKKTFKRKIILSNFKAYIDPLYEKDYNSWLINGNELRISKWLLRKSEILVNDLKFDNDSLHLKNSNKKLNVNFKGNKVIVGNYEYTIANNIVELNQLVLSPELWLGNQQFVDFFGITAVTPKHYETPSSISIEAPAFKFNSNSIPNQIINELKSALRDKLYDLSTIHLAAIVLFNSTEFNSSIATNYLSKVLSSEKTELSDLALVLLQRLRYHPNSRIRVRALEVITPYIMGDVFTEFLTEIYSTSDNPKILKDLTLDIRVLKTHHFSGILNELAILRHSEKDHTQVQLILIEALLNTITEYGINHPNEYKWSRSELVKWNLSSAPNDIIELTKNLIDDLTIGFRKWLGINRLKAIDNETGEEYTWQDVVVFDPNVDDRYKQNLQNAFSQTTFLKEAIFLLSNYKIVELDDIQARGIWVMFLGNNHGKSVFRVTIQTRDYVSYNFVINYNEDLSDQTFIEEIKWLIVTGSTSRGRKLVEDFGGHWPRQRIFTEEYIQGETLYQNLERNKNIISSTEDSDLWRLRWLHFIWNGLMAYFSFYRRTNFKLYIENSSIKNLIIPEYDYAIGTRLVSISDESILDKEIQLFHSVYKNFILDTEQEYKGLQHVANWEVIFCALLQTVTIKKGIEILKNLSNQHTGKNRYGLTKTKINNFIKEINENGLLTKQVVFASLRYERWLALNPDATLSARGTMLRQLYNDYHLNELINDYPETRIRYFLMTAFKDSDNTLQNELLKIQKDLRSNKITAIDLEEKINQIINKVEISEDDKYFITRLMFEHIDTPEQGKEFVWQADREGKLELITAVVDGYGETHQIRQAGHPKEIAKFQSLLLNSNLSAIFNQQHEFLLLFNSNIQLIGGVYWKKVDDKIAYLERIVIHPKYRKRHLGSHLLDELFNRLKNKRYLFITVGFFQAGLFYNKGFHIDKRFGGLVKKLD